jgi:putative CocE/NonD family hydrolase
LGASYQGLSQWAIVGHPQDYLQAMVIVQSDSDPRSIIYPSGIFALETVLAWLSILENQEKSTLRVLANALWGDRSLRPAYRTLPLSDCDQAAFGRTIDYFQQWLAHRPEEPWWDEINFGRELASAPAILMVGGWYDLHLPGQLSNFCALQAANLKVRLVIGPWTHESLGITGPILRETFAWFDRLLRANQSRESDNQNQPGLHLYLMGSRKWIDLESWPPPADRQRWYLYGDASLAKSTPEAAPPRQYIYDPAKPTPSIGGGATIVGKTSGSRNQRERERRSDVLTYTTEILLNALTIVGPSSAAIYIRTDVKYLDLFVRLCDVTPQGKSLNVTDGIARLGPADFARSSDGSIEVLVPFWPIAYTFKAGHRLRLQVSSAAHPMYVRNLCTGEPMEDGTQTRKAVVQVLNDPDHPSGIEIPVVWL